MIVARRGQGRKLHEIHERIGSGGRYEGIQIWAREKRVGGDVARIVHESAVRVSRVGQDVVKWNRVRAGARAEDPDVPVGTDGIRQQRPEAPVCRGVVVEGPVVPDDVVDYVRVGKRQARGSRELGAAGEQNNARAVGRGRDKLASHKRGGRARAVVVRDGVIRYDDVHRVGDADAARDKARDIVHDHIVHELQGKGSAGCHVLAACRQETDGGGIINGKVALYQVRVHGKAARALGEQG